MKLKVILFLSIFGMLVLSNLSSGYAEGKPSPEVLARGKQLFDSKEALGVKFACILCHKQDKAVKASKIANLGDKFPTVINKYITDKAKGKALAPDSADMKALMAYIQYEHAK